ncbi:TPA: hypothetical protein N2D87_003681 [Clostridium botulinum]|uniref:hypothetical protein n=1 Tax=Clostridium botulinum TaxID=1491 RepID=UPI00330D8FD5|nr:hypothetical protein [Clostridium botulinum]HCL4449756.1 hypothetical protein [Clostridium botulinum]HCL4452025.1 hypothetical protein [Clostridium botulinum]HCL4454255.1 hypothetical protein [Clostridium botulinum]HCL4455914.1 hypothetical protein [Clostridium botulinum]
MDELSKEDKKNMKKFELKEKVDYIVYLQELIGRAYKCMRNERRYLEELSNYINIKINENCGKNPKDIIVKEEIYSKFNDCISNCEAYLLNLAGDQQQSSISYAKFRKIISKRKKKGTLDFDIRDLDEKVINLLNDLNKIRNWANHVPESLLTSEIKMIREGKLMGHSKNPIVININECYSLDYLKHLYETSYNFYESMVIIHQNMKKDYSCLIGESVEIRKLFLNKPVKIDHLEATKLSAKIQGIKGEKDKE